VARGYWDRPELTAERFVPDPFADDSSARMYKTGDLARWLADGTIEFIGRNDSQVKIRGHRVELGEIERALREHPAVQEAAVTAQEDHAGGKRLVAFVVVQGPEHRLEESGLRKSPAAAENGHRSEMEVPAGGLLQQRLAAELRRALKKKLPEHMIPVIFVMLESLPLMANGKIDRQALPAVPALGDGGEGYEAPGTAVEERLAEIWASVLRVERVGRSGNFFDLGGHSLLATSMVLRFRSAFGIDVPVRAIFESPTIAELAEVIELDLKSQGRELPEAGQQATPKHVASGTRPSVFPLSHQQEQLWFLDRFQPDSDFYNVPFAWTLTGDLDVPRLERSLREVVQRHEILRTSFVMGDDQEPM